MLAGALHSRHRERTDRHPGPFFGFYRHTARAFWGWGVLVHLGAVGLTFLLVHSGSDLAIQRFLQRYDPLGQAFPWLCLLFGNFWHVIAGVLIFVRGKVKKDLALMGAGMAGIQALLVNLFINTGEKLLSGRRGPLRMVGEDLHHAPFIKTKDPADFRFEFWHHTFADGRFFWPSGHTSSAFAFVAALVAYYPLKRWIPVIGYPLALLMGFAMIDGDFHWTSDVVAGALLGHLAGWIVGKSFRERYVE